MDLPAPDPQRLLTDKEKQTLRLIVRGHDAKSIARELGLSVHTINDRLRDARRKLAVSSSREAARRLLEREGGTPESVVPDEIGAAAGSGAAHPAAAGGRFRFAAITGAAVMTILLGLLALAAQPQATPPADPPPAARATAEEAVARDFLALVDQRRWADSYAFFGNAFRKQNSAKVWADVSEKVRPPLGAVVSRALQSQQELPAPPNGYTVLKFRTSFANKPDTFETVTLERENGEWRVVAILIG